MDGYTGKRVKIILGTGNSDGLSGTIVRKQGMAVVVSIPGRYESVWATVWEYLPDTVNLSGAECGE